MAPGLTVRPPQNASDWDALRELCWEYRDFLFGLPGDQQVAVTAAYPQDAYTHLMGQIAEKHSAPNGVAGLVRADDGTPIACGMSQMLSDTDIEFKRVYVRPMAQGQGLGRTLMRYLIDTAKPLGARRVLMDTGKVLTAAQALYDDMGFRRRGPYSDIPAHVAKHLVFYEMAL